MTKPFHAGHAAEAGVISADLIAFGWTASEDVLEAPLGFYQGRRRRVHDPRLVAEKLGKPWMFASPGDLIKRFPCGTIQQSVMDKMIELIRANNIKAADVQKIEIRGNQTNASRRFSATIRRRAWRQSSAWSMRSVFCWWKAKQG